jgi:aminoglycoside N3'-acetyltransferase
MTRLLRGWARQALPPALRRQLKRLARRAETAGLSGRLRADEFRQVLVEELELARGDTVLVHASFGRLKTKFAPSIAISILQDVVGDDGNILMPVYPGNGDEWLAGGEIFDPMTSAISTGILAAEFVHTRNVRVSKHPIKAVAAWGKERDTLLSEHHLSRTPYDALSPYAKMLTLPNAKIIGLGTRRMSFIHCGEDTVPGYVAKFYSPRTMSGQCRDENGKVITVATLVHRSELQRNIFGPALLSAEGCAACQERVIDDRYYYAGDARGIYEHMRQYAQRQIAQAR